MRPELRDLQKSDGSLGATKYPSWRQAEDLELPEGYDHDLGFITFCSFGKDYELNHNAIYRQALLDAADYYYLEALLRLRNIKQGVSLKE